MVMQSIRHGGDLCRAEHELGVSTASCLDLSTGISPWLYPVGHIPETIWQRLPYDDSGLITAAASYYGCLESMITPVPGSQDAIRRLPRLLASIDKVSRVALPELAYQEHKIAWENAGHKLFFYTNFLELEMLVKQGRVEHVVVVNPNNPSAQLIEPKQYSEILDALPEEGYLITDEAFMDVYPDSSLTCFLDNPNIIVLRSIGKFFGLAGLRLGFVLGKNTLAEALKYEMAPWGVSHPALWLGEKALLDHDWQSQQRSRIEQQSQWLVSQLEQHFSSCTLGTAGLFTTLLGNITLLQQAYLNAAEAGILLRFEIIDNEQAWLRIGLPGEHQKVLSQFLRDTLHNFT